MQKAFEENLNQIARECDASRPVRGCKAWDLCLCFQRWCTFVAIVNWKYSRIQLLQRLCECVAMNEVQIAMFGGERERGGERALQCKYNCVSAHPSVNTRLLIQPESNSANAKEVLLITPPSSGSSTSSRVGTGWRLHNCSRHTTAVRTVGLW